MLDALKVSVPEPAAFVTTHAFGSIGLGLAAAIGAGVARPDRAAVLLAGDGGFMMSGFSELNTAVQNGIDLIVVIYDDGSYGAEHIQFHNKDMDPGLSFTAGRPSPGWPTPWAALVSPFATSAISTPPPRRSGAAPVPSSST